MEHEQSFDHSSNEEVITVPESLNNDGYFPAVKKTKFSYKICSHCCKEVSKKIYKEHRRLFYDNTKKIWAKELDKLMLRTDEDSFTSDFSSLDEFDVKGGYLENTSGVDHDQASGFSDLEHESDHPISTNHHDESCLKRKCTLSN